MRKSIYLNMNEMPFLPPSNILKAAQKGLLNLNRYAAREDTECLKGLLARYAKISESQIILAPGSDFLLREIILSFSKGRKVVMISPSFFPTVQAAKQFAAKFVTIRLSSTEFDLEPELLLEELDVPSLVIIDNPNNPTGNLLLDRKTVEHILHKKDALLVIDEAYFEFSGKSFADLVSNYPNLTITRTMDKAFSLAGARIGYLIAGKTFADAFSSFYPFLPRSSIYTSIEALRSPGYMDRNVGLIINERERIKKELEDLSVRVYPSNTNFLLVKTEMPEISRMLKDNNVFIADISDQLTPGFIRVSIGTPEENNIFIKKFRRVLSESQ